MVAFGFSFCILFFFHFEESLNITVCKWYKISVLLVAIIQENFDKQPWTENSEGPARVTQKASDVSSADWRYQTHKKLLYITFVLLQPFSGLGFLVKHDSLYNKYIINHYVWINYPLLLINWHFTQRYNLSPLDRMPVHRKVTPPNLAESQTLTSLCRVQLTYHQGTSSPTHWCLSLDTHMAGPYSSFISTKKLRGQLLPF